MENGIFFGHLEDGCRAILMEDMGVQDVCPRCNIVFSARVIDSWRAGRRIHCAACDWCGTWRTDTALSGSVLSCAQVVVMFIAFRSGAADNGRIASFIGVHPDTVRRWRRWWQAREESSLV